ncbi:SsrA-binding protein SmpB [Arcanobacterium hippocoleae]|uniref:SsrA-binding protein n=1 Tax=Arcanobacterium hippocoleae TaxID=149017 RepID=A0ABU1SZV8_9ACTO|nr:SsrA-binding protein SmpB [Arcanobacterium hippocoleae]MDR6938664.1 SsrA-binding protein [Arcanobacterium hippocoleae]
MAKKSNKSAGKLTPAQKAKAEADAKKVIARNKKARHDYHIDKIYEAGLVLSGTEVKALRMGRASLTESWIEFDRRGEAWLVGCNIPIYAMGSWTNHAPTQKRKLLLHQYEIDNLRLKVRDKGTTVVPLELYFVRGRVKIEIALARGKKDWDKRETLRRKQDERDTARAMSDAHKRGRI